MDLKSLTPKIDDIKVTLKHPSTGEILYNKDGSPMTITLYAKHSQGYKDYKYKQTDLSIKKAQETGEGFSISAAQMDEEEIKLYAGITKEWNITYEDKTPKYTESKARSIYEELFWIIEQLDVKITGTDVFIGV